MDTIATEIDRFVSTGMAGNLVWAGPLVIALAVVTNLLIRAAARSFVAISPEFEPLAGPRPVIGSTIVFGVAAVVAFAIVARFSSQPAATYRVVATIALGLSFIPMGSLVSTPGGSRAALGTLAAMHLGSFAICAGLLPLLVRVAG